jgi:hypothetical protein
MAGSQSLGEQIQKPVARPKGIAFVVVIEVLVGALGIVGGIGSLSASNLPQPQGLGFLQALAPVLPIVLIVIGVFFIVSSYGLWRGFGWAWTATIVFEIIHIIADIGFVASRAFAVDKIIGLVVILAILFYLTRRNVRSYYGKGGSAA